MHNYTQNVNNRIVVKTMNADILSYLTLFYVTLITFGYQLPAFNPCQVGGRHVTLRLRLTCLPTGNIIIPLFGCECQLLF